MSEPKDLKDAVSDLLEVADNSAGRRWRAPAKINALRPFKNEILEAYEKGLTFRKIAEIFTNRGHEISMAQIGRAIRLFLDEDVRDSKTGEQQNLSPTTATRKLSQQGSTSARPPRKFALVMQHGDLILDALKKGQSIAQIRNMLGEMPNGFYVSVADLGRAILILRKERSAEIPGGETSKVQEMPAMEYEAPSKSVIRVREKYFAQELLRGRRAAALSRPAAALPKPPPPGRPAPDPFRQVKASSRAPLKNREEALVRQRKPTRKPVREKPATAGRKPDTARRRRGSS